MHGRDLTLSGEIEPNRRVRGAWAMPSRRLPVTGSRVKPGMTAERGRGIWKAPSPDLSGRPLPQRERNRLRCVAGRCTMPRRDHSPKGEARRLPRVERAYPVDCHERTTGTGFTSPLWGKVGDPGPDPGEPGEGALRQCFSRRLSVAGSRVKPGMTRWGGEGRASYPPSPSLPSSGLTRGSAGQSRGKRVSRALIARLDHPH